MRRLSVLSCLVGLAVVTSALAKPVMPQPPLSQRLAVADIVVHARRALGNATLTADGYSPPYIAAIAVIARGEDVSLGLTLPWLAVIPGGAVAVWVSSPKRARRWAHAPPGSGRTSRA